MLRVRSLILCEDVRREETGKEFIIGVYSGGIRFFGPGPGKLRQLCFRMEVEQDDDENAETTLSLELVAPSGATLINVRGQGVKMAGKGRGALVFANQDLSLYEAGTYAIKVTTNAEPYEDTVEVSFEAPKP